jgi:hypothetical protein
MCLGVCDSVFIFAVSVVPSERRPVKVPLGRPTPDECVEAWLAGFGDAIKDAVSVGMLVGTEAICRSPLKSLPRLEAASPRRDGKDVVRRKRSNDFQATRLRGDDVIDGAADEAGLLMLAARVRADVVWNAERPVDVCMGTGTIRCCSCW